MSGQGSAGGAGGNSSFSTSHSGGSGSSYLPGGTRFTGVGGGAGTAKSYEGSVWTEKSLENKEDKKFGEPIWVWKK